MTRAMLTHQFISAALTVIPLASVLAWPLAKRQGERFPAEPGHWLLILMGVSAISFTLISTVWFSFGGNSLGIDETLGMVLFSCYAIAIAVSGVLAMLIAALATRSARWKVAFGLLGIHSFRQAAQHGLVVLSINAMQFALLGTIIGVATMLASFAAFIGVVVVSILDLRSVQRDWLHWTGVV